jgi:hypothetical protein
MPSSRRRCTLIHRSALVTGRIYSLRHSAPKGIKVDVDDDASSRYPLLERHLDDEKVQPFTHDCKVSVHDGSQSYQFFIFFKLHVRLKINSGIPGNSLRKLPFRGDAIMMRAGVRIPGSIVNLRGRDRRLADQIIPLLVRYPRLVLTLIQFGPVLRRKSFTGDEQGGSAHRVLYHLIFVWRVAAALNESHPKYLIPSSRHYYL